MNIELSSELVENEINNVVNQAVVSAMKGYEIQAAISKTISEQIAEGVVCGAIEKAISNINLDNVTESIAAELQRNVIKGVDYIIKESFVDTIMNLKKINSYDKKYETEREKVRTQVFKC